MKLCSIDGCGNPMQAKAMCSMHYSRARRTGSPGEAEARRMVGGRNVEKTCSVPGCEHARIARTWCATHWRRWRAEGNPGEAARRWRVPVAGETEKPCSKCGLIKPLSSYYLEKRQAGGRMSQCRACFMEGQKASRRLRLYGLTPEQHDALVARAAGRCSSCGSAAMLVIDHDHRTGSVRDLLCDRCNRLLGIADDDVDLLLAAVAYVRKHRKA